MYFYNGYVLKETTPKRLSTPTRQSIGAFWSSHKDVALQRIAYETNFMETAYAA